MTLASCYWKKSWDVFLTLGKCHFFLWAFWLPRWFWELHGHRDLVRQCLPLQSDGGRYLPHRQSQPPNLLEDRQHDHLEELQLWSVLSEVSLDFLHINGVLNCKIFVNPKNHKLASRDMKVYITSSDQYFPKLCIKNKFMCSFLRSH